MTATPAHKPQQIRLSLTILGIALLVFAYQVRQIYASPPPVSIPTHNQPTLGNPQAKVHLVIFEDFKCPYCKKFDEVVFPEIEKNFIQTGKIQYTFINRLVISPQGDSRDAALAGECLYQQNTDLFFKYLHRMYQIQQDERLTWATRSKILEVSRTLPGANLQSLQSCMAHTSTTQAVVHDQDIGNTLNVSGTPSLYINGVHMRRALDVKAVTRAIQKALQPKH